VIRNFSEYVQQEQANRLVAIAEPSREQLMMIEEGDVVTAGDDLITRTEKVIQDVPKVKERKARKRAR